MPEQKYKSHSSENCSGKQFDQSYVKEWLRGALGNRDYAVKNYQKTENKWKRELKFLKKQNKIPSSMKKNRLAPWNQEDQEDQGQITQEAQLL